jgi:sulfur carrier protein ThiS
VQVTVKVMGQFRGRASAGREALVVELPEGSTVLDAVRAVGLTHDEEWNASLDGRLAEEDRVLRGGEALLVFTAIAGGQRE